MFSLGFGVATLNNDDQILEVFYPEPILSPSSDLMAAIVAATEYKIGNHVLRLKPPQIIQISEQIQAISPKNSEFLSAAYNYKKEVVLTLLATDDAIEGTAEAYLKLHLLSHRLVKPHNVNLQGIFTHLPNLAWTNFGAIEPSELPNRQTQARLNGQNLHVYAVDKFPPMANYVVPSGVRIADSARIRLGAYLGEGTTVMHEGFINFNAGCTGPNMIEGRISAGVFVEQGSDLGGGCSTMGTLSGGGDVIISVGTNCLIGANAGIGIPLGNRNTVEAGLYLTAGVKVSLLDEQNQQIAVVKARDLAGKDDLLFRRNSQNGAIECKTNRNAISLNSMLHTN